MPTVEDAADALYGAPLSEFVAERKRFAKGGLKEIERLKKPTMSAWVVNQLHRRAADEMAALFEAGAKLRGGDFAASAEQRAALQKLRTRAAAILKEDGHAANEGTLLRVQQTLQALSAIGSWEPDRPGQLVADRDPPGFDALAGLAPADVKAAPPRETKKLDDVAERRRAAEIEKLEKAAAVARAEAEQRAADVAALRDALEQAETALSEARRDAHEAERAVETARRRA